MLKCELDHLVISAASLQAAGDFIKQELGVTAQPGGEHPRMGTHNCLVKLGDSTYLEGIAANPFSSRPERRRWFELDALEKVSLPRLATWVLRVNDIEAAVAASPIPLGRIEPMNRGTLHWRITIPEDGSLPLDGVAPLLIQWEPGAHPASRMVDSGCSLLELEGFHPAAQSIAALLVALGFEGPYQVVQLPADHKPCLVATFQTPLGERKMGGNRLPKSSRLQKSLDRDEGD
jgi:hypothetical protein